MAKDQSRMLGEGGKEGSLLTLFGEMAIAIHIWKTFIGNTQSYFFFFSFYLVFSDIASLPCLIFIAVICFLF